MKKIHLRYLTAILHALELIPQGSSDDYSNVDRDLISKAAQWALNDPNFEFTKYVASPLRPVVSSLKENGSEYWIQPIPLTISKKGLPVMKQPDAKSLELQLEKLKDSLDSKISKSQDILLALEYHASTLSVGKNNTYIPLYDFVKITTALAHCIENGKDKKAVLLGGNLSGIQSYLYEIISKNASKLLKGRSFYLHLLTETLVEKVIVCFNVTKYHVIYNSGGRFYVIIPHTDDLKNKISDFAASVSRSLFEAHSLSLFVDIRCSEPFGMGDDVSLPWKELFVELNKAKFKRLSDNSALLKKVLSDPIEHGGDVQRDAITNEEIKKEEISYIGEGEDRIAVSSFTKDQIENLGRRLRDAKFLISTNDGFSGPEKKVSFKDAFGKWHLLTSKEPREISVPDDAEIRKINSPNDEFPFIFYGGNDVPVFDKESLEKYEDKESFGVGWPMPFDCIAEGEKMDRLGVLRMDVDFLGKVFSELGTEGSLVKYAALSRSLDWFFKGYLNTLRGDETKSYKDRTIIVYSGGDDLFVVGRWLEVYNLAMEIQHDFSNWSCKNLTISGGMVIVPPKFPIMQGAIMAGKAEEKAKEYEVLGKPKKNAFNILGVSLSWEEEMPLVVELSSKLKYLLNLNSGKGIEKSFLQKIAIHEMSRREQEEKGMPKKWVWRLAYDFAQIKQRLTQGKNNSGKNDEVVNVLDSWQKAAVTGKFQKCKSCGTPALKLLYLAARIVELEGRTISTN